MATNANLVVPKKNTGQPASGTKDGVSLKDYGIDMRAIEQWASRLKSGSYASLTGPGETVTPGALTQLGDFIVENTSATSALEVVAGGIVLNATGTDILDIVGNNGVTIENAVAGVLNIEQTGPDGIAVNPGAGGIGFAGAAVPIQTVTGSRGGNAALASLLSALAAIGLIIDGTTP